MATYPSNCLADLIPEVTFPDALAKKIASNITLDSRQVMPGSIFCALNGETVNREEFIPQAVDSGAVVVLVESSSGVETLKNDNRGHAAIVELIGLRKKIARIAARFFDEPSKKLKVIGVTGTNGKTSCVELFTQVMRHLGINVASMGTLGWSDKAGEYHATGMTTVDAIENQRLMANFVEGNVSHVAMEVSSHGVHQGRVNNIDFSYRILTNISHDHLDYHGDFECYANTKKSFLLAGDSVAIINADDPEAKTLLPKLTSALSYSTQMTDADVHVKSADYRIDGFSAEIVTPQGPVNIRTPLIGAFNLSNLLAVIAILANDGMDILAIENAVNQIQPVVGRLEKVTIEHADHTPHVFIDYAHTPDAIEQALVALRQHCEGRLMIVFGCGGDRDKGKRPLMGEVALQHADTVILTSDNPRSENPENIIQDIASGMKGGRQFFIKENRREAIALALSMADEKDAILVTGKGHENYQEVHGQRKPFNDYEEVMRLLA